MVLEGYLGKTFEANLNHIWLQGGTFVLETTVDFRKFCECPNVVVHYFGFHRILVYCYIYGDQRHNVLWKEWNVVEKKKFFFEKLTSLTWTKFDESSAESKYFGISTSRRISLICGRNLLIKVVNFFTKTLVMSRRSLKIHTYKCKYQRANLLNINSKKNNLPLTPSNFQRMSFSTRNQDHEEQEIYQ